LETGVRPFDPPLLPFEIALIETLGCTEEEYRKFIRHAQLRARVRPAEYEHIPEIDNEVGTIIAVVSLVIGLASTAVSILLAPKVPTLENQPRIRNRQLSDQIGPTRFNQTTSFDNVSSLAEYNQPIPIPFGKRDVGADSLSTGGIIIAPALVWSRLFANGSFQSYEGIYVAGQFGLTTPQLGGIRVGTTALSILNNNEYALYWSSKAGSNRPSAIIAGSSSATLGRQVFTSPTADGQFSSGFSFAYNPQNQSQFGTFSPIQNGTAFRFNWEIVSAPEASTLGSENQEQRAEIKARRRKIAGAKADVLTLFDDQTAESIAAVGQPGVGRQYSKRMGITRINGQPYSVRTFVNVTVGATAVFTINPENWDAFAASDFKDTEVNLTDLESSADAWRTRADDILTVGSRWIIGGTVWVVESRTGSIPSSQVNVNLRCTEVIGTGQIGAAGTRAITEALAGYDGRDFDPNTNIGTGFYPLCRYSEAAIRPVRRDTEVIEIGIKSQVWNRASGLTNFNALVTPAKLLRLDQKNIAITTPRLDRYFARSSFFSILVRPVQKFGQGERAWVRIPIFFCVTGSAPIDQFNLVRIRPRVTDYYEYRIVPSPGAQVNPPTSDDSSQSAVQSQLVLQLDAEGILGDTNFGQDYSTAYGAFRISTKGKLIAVGELTKNKELTTNASTAFTGGTPTTPGTTTTTNTPTAVTFLSSSPTPVAAFRFPDNAVYFELFGDPRTAVVGTVKSTTFTVTQATRTITIRAAATLVNGIAGTGTNANLSQDYVTLTGTTRVWRNITYSVQSFTGDWPLNTPFDYTRTLSAGNVFRTSSVSSVTFKFSISNVSTTTSTGSPTPNTPTSPDGVSRAARIFEQQSQLADVSFYQELTKSNESGPEHEVVYINEYIANQTPANYTDLSTLAIAVKSSGQIGSVGQIRAWLPSGINVPRLIDSGTGPSNLFADLLYYLLLDQSQGVGNIVPEELIDTQSLQITARFLRANKIFYDGVIEDSEALRSFIFNLAPLQLCNFTIKNGRFGLIPALPYDSNFNISTRPVPVEQIFTSGNIIEDSLQLQYIDIAQRTNFRALVTWRQTVDNDLPTQASVIVDWADVVSNDRPPTQQVFDLTDFCTNREQALRTARFLLSIRRRVTQTVTFKTVPDALSIQPGSYIRVMTTATTFNANTNGVITDAGSLVTINPLPNGTYNAMVYNPTTQETFERSLTISNNTVSDPALRGTLFTLMSQQNSSSIYQVEQLTLDEDGLINVSAIQVPVDSSGASIVAKDVLTPGNFTYTE
jgi:hypothetical protein